MELDLTWILLGLPVAFGLGWLASRLDLRQLRIANRTQWGAEHLRQWALRHDLGPYARRVDELLAELA